MLYVVNEDAPGFIGRLGTLLGEAGVNIGTFHLGRRSAGGEAVLLLSVDEAVTPELIAKVRALAGVKTVMGLAFLATSPSPPLGVHRVGPAPGMT